MPCGAALAFLLLGAPGATPPPAEPAAPAAGPRAGPVILFLIDNSASLPPLDPDEKRVAALEKMFTFLEDRPYRLVLFGGRREVFVDDASRYDNRGQWTDFYFAFAKAGELMRGYPEKTEFKIILLTDGLLDPDPADWKDAGLPPGGGDLKASVARRTLALIQELKAPLYVILVGEVPGADVAPGDPERSPRLVLEMVRAANGAKASATAQSLAAFFDDDGLLLRKFVFRVAPYEGLKKIAPVIRRIVAAPSVAVELQFLTSLVLPLGLFLFLLLGILVRSFPGPGDVEIVELEEGAPAHLAVDRLHRLESGGWAPTGLSLVGSAREAAASVTYEKPPLDLSGSGLDSSELDALTLELLPLGLDELRAGLESYSDSGSKEEKIYALNLDYMAKNFDPGRAEALLRSTAAERAKLPPLDFLRAKAHLLSNEALRRKLTEPRAHLVGYGKDAERGDLQPGRPVRIGRYGFLVKDVARGGRKDARLVLYYDRVPSLLGLKALLPGAFQRLFRFRRSSQRVVN